MIGIKVLGLAMLQSKLMGGFHMKAAQNAIGKATLKLAELVKKATVVKTGRLAGSISHQISSNKGKVFTNVQYAPFVEYGTKYMEARHREGSSDRVLGQGMFSYGRQQLELWLKQRGDQEISTAIEKEFEA